MFSESSYETTIGEYAKWVSESSVIDMKLHGGLLSQLHIDNLPLYIKNLGLTSFKIFLPYKGEEAHKLGGLNSLSDGQVLEAFAVLKKFNALPIVHCENPDLIDYYMAKNQRAADQSLVAWESTRPAIVESESANKILYFATKIGNRVAIAHVSAGRYCRYDRKISLHQSSAGNMPPLPRALERHGSGEPWQSQPSYTEQTRSESTLGSHRGISLSDDRLGSQRMAQTAQERTLERLRGAA